MSSLTTRLRATTCCVALVGVVFAASATAATQRDDAITSHTNIQYGIAGGERLMLDVYLPRSEAGKGAASLHPAIVFVHGGGWVGGDKSAYVDYGRWFARNGFAGFCINYRLVKPNGNKWPAQIDDVQLAVRWVRDHAATYGVYPNRIGAFGDSAGGHLVALLATWPDRDTALLPLGQHSNHVQCVVDLYGPTDLTVPLPTQGPFNINV